MEITVDSSLPSSVLGERNGDIHRDSQAGEKNALSRRHFVIVIILSLVMIGLIYTRKQIASIEWASMSYSTSSKKTKEEGIAETRLTADGVETAQKQGARNELLAANITNASDTAVIETHAEGILIVHRNASSKVSLTLNATDAISLNLEINSEKRDRNDELQACQIRVTNKESYHYEVMESVAKQIPYEYLNLSDTCNHQHLHFEFDTPWSTKPRTESWILDMNDRVFNTSIVDETTGITRSFGRTITTKPNRTFWDTTIQVSCHCDRFAKPWLLNIKKVGPRVCILHGRCNRTMGMPNAIQVSPHHERYFVPTALPHYGVDLARRKGDKKLEICSIGATFRRNWKLLVPFLENANNEDYFDKIRIRMLGKGGFPAVLRPYRQKTEMVDEVIGDDREYYATVKVCSILILAVNEEKGKDYFKSIPGSHLKLSGSIPPIIAFERPFVIPDELVELYRAHLPMQVPHRGYNHQNDTSFSEALSSLVEEFIGNESARTEEK